MDEQLLPSVPHDDDERQYPLEHDPLQHCAELEHLVPFDRHELDRHTPPVQMPEQHAPFELQLAPIALQLADERHDPDEQVNPVQQSLDEPHAPLAEPQVRHVRDEPQM